MKLKVTHTPLYGCYGMIQEVEKNAKEAKEKTTQEYYEIVINKTIDLERFKIMPISFEDNGCELEVIDNVGVNVSNTSDRAKIINLNLGDDISLYRDITDCIESWVLELVN